MSNFDIDIDTLPPGKPRSEYPGLLTVRQACLPFTELSQDQIQPTRIAYEHWGPDFDFYRPCFGSQLFAVTCRGQGMHLDADGQERLLKPGTFFACGGGLPRHHRVMDANGMTLLLVICNAGAATNLASRCFGSPNFIFDLCPPDRLIHYFSLALQEALTGMYTICTDLISVILNIAKSQVSQFSAPPDTRSLQTFQQCKQYMHLHAHDRPTLSQIAEACGIHPSYLSRLFFRYQQTTPLEYLHRLQLSEATELLESSDLPIHQIALQCGYQDPFNFSRTFKRLFGLAPLHYRQQVQQPLRHQTKQ